jgi:hypothetical protein
MPFIPSAAQILSSSPTATSIFGTGADGDVTIAAGTTTLTRDMQYNNLVVNGTLSTAGFRVFIRGTLTGAGTITYVQDNNTQTGSPGVPYNDTPGYYNLGLRCQGGAGNTGAGAVGIDPGFATKIGGRGGSGGLGASGAGGAGGIANDITTGTTGVGIADISKILPLMVIMGQGYNNGSLLNKYFGGTGGGGGGGDGVNNGTGGAAGGGVVVVVCFNASGFTGSLTAPGASQTSTGPIAGNCGGGGGGGGGFVGFFYATAPSGAYTISAAKGLGGSKIGTGVAGSDGEVGTTLAAFV